MKKETAVEWFFKLSKERELDKFDLEQAKAMEREQMLNLISFVRIHNKMGKNANDLLQEFETFKEGKQ